MHLPLAEPDTVDFLQRKEATRWFIRCTPPSMTPSIPTTPAPASNIHTQENEDEDVDVDDVNDDTERVREERQRPEDDEYYDEMDASDCDDDVDDCDDDVSKRETLLVGDDDDDDAEMVDASVVGDCDADADVSLRRSARVRRRNTAAREIPRELQQYKRQRQNINANNPSMTAAEHGRCSELLKEAARKRRPESPAVQ